MQSQASAQEQLDLLAADRERVASRTVLPWWHYPAGSAALFASSTAHRVPDRWFTAYLALILAPLAMTFVLSSSRHRRRGRISLRARPRSRQRRALHWLAGLGFVAVMIVVMVQVERASTQLWVSGALAAGSGAALWLDDRRSAAALRVLP